MSSSSGDSESDGDVVFMFDEDASVTSSDESFDGVTRGVISDMALRAQIWAEVYPFSMFAGVDTRCIPLLPFQIHEVKIVTKPPAECVYDVVAGYLEVSKQSQAIAEMATQLALKGLWRIS